MVARPADRTGNGRKHCQQNAAAVPFPAPHAGHVSPSGSRAGGSSGVMGACIRIPFVPGVLGRFGADLYAYSFLAGAFYLGPQSGRLKRLYQAEGPTAPAATAIVRRLFLVSRVELALMVLIVLDMVLKPGL